MADDNSGDLENKEIKSILIVDDQDSILSALEMVLSSDQYNVISAADGGAALELISNRKDGEDIFLIISDQRMPQMTGIQMFESVMELLPDAIRVLMSGYTDKEIVAASVNQGIVHRCILKPWRMDELDLIVHHALFSPEKFKNSDCLGGELECFNPNIMQKDIKKFNDYRNDMTLGAIALHNGFITRRQLDTAMAETQNARQAGREVSIENIMFEKGLISSEDMGKLIAAARRKIGKSFGTIAAKEYGASVADVKRCLMIQSNEFTNTSICRHIGDILVAENILTEEQKDSIVIDMTYSEKEDISKSISEPIGKQSFGKVDSLENKILLNKRKQYFFRQRAVDKLFCKIAIDKNFATESEILQVLEEQLLDFTKDFEVRKIRDIMLSNGILSKEQADNIDSLIHIKPDLSKQKENQSKKRVFTIGDNKAFELSINNDDMEATIKLIGEMPKGMNADGLKYLLKTHNIIYGLENDIDIELFLKRASEKKRDSFVIAKGRNPKYGRNASIKYFFEDENRRIGRELISGKFDYRDRGEIVIVSEGDILAQKIPSIPAIKGSTITGIEIPTPNPVDVNLSCGKGSMLSKDVLTVRATVRGRPDLTLGGKISVMHEKAVNGNVDFKTGNIIFGGDVNVTGTLLPGFSVTADNLTVTDIDSGEVNVENNIIVKNNIIGANIKSGGNLLVAHSMKKCTVSARGDVVIEKEIIDCTIITSGKVIISRGRIVASTIHAAKGIEAKEIGSNTSSPCNLFPGADDHANNAIGRLNQEIVSSRKELESLDEAYKECEKRIFEQLNKLSDMSRVQERMLADKTSTLNERNRATSSAVKEHMNEKIGDIDKNIAKAERTLNKLFHEHEVNQNRLNSIQAKTKDCNVKIHDLINERNSFQKWYEDQKKVVLKKRYPGVVVNGVMFDGTQIKATHSAMKVNEDIRSSKIYQVLNNDNPDRPFYEMRIDSITQSRR
ncbi:MAG: DUF342 domain-containing protein [Desulfamplus sp.]|nr:DUF342 domain-containing protein [Desulfamplus sp.]